MRKLLPAVTVLLLASAPAFSVNARDRQIDPTNRVGAIVPTSTEADLVRLYGAANVKRLRPEPGGPEVTVLFEHTPDELTIEWKNGARHPRRIVIDGGAWMTTDGVAVGLPIAALEQINGGPFDVTGANWDRPIRAVSWKGGRLAPQLQVDLVPSGVDVELPKKLRSERAFFDSSDPVLHRSDLVVKRLILEW